MMLIADTHVHIYPCYDLAALLEHGARNLRALRPGTRDAVLALCLAEAQRYRIFRDLKDGQLRPPAPYEVTATSEPESLLIEGGANGPLHLVAGRQIITHERIEVLVTGFDLDLPDGRPIGQVLDTVREVGGVPVINWAPGKWFFQRGRIVGNLIDREGPGRLAVCDTTLRPTLWPEPRLMRRARAGGLAVVAGSDPLPFAGEEKYAGTYGIVADIAGAAGPATAIRALLAARNPVIEIAGRRPGLVTVLRRLKNNHDVKKRTPRD
ncbi:MAG: hypothetical protein JXB04_11605 [Kiritimatiellae bacterium]|nr:hypothetical protein [Kiritimatiellia bacterium]